MLDISTIWSQIVGGIKDVCKPAPEEADQDKSSLEHGGSDEVDGIRHD